MSDQKPTTADPNQVNMQMQYGQPQGYGMQQVQPGAPPPGYAQPGYGAPPQQGYGAPPQGYGAPPQGYGAPQQGYGAPPQGYAPGFGPPPGMAPQQQWAARPDAIPGCPPGLEYLTTLDQMLVKQQVELMELITGWETSNKYKVLNSMGQQIYFAAEESDMCMRQCCGPQRGFTIHITDNLGQELIQVKREFKCCAGCCWCASSDSIAHEISIEAPPGQVVGYVRQEQSCWEPNYTIRDANHEPILRMKGPCCIIQGPCCPQDQEFIISSEDGANEVGKISKQWTGLMREAFTDADNFGVSFPKDLDVKVKATLLGAVFLIDFMFFEQKQNNNNR
ncbi:phospholipid scramblase 2-like isoform X1 [Mytilus edulis]|uniref:Phospholipid scramblase n=2 Tax=Mytilus TaxID=6548 RepID=A0A8S3S7P0_MYTED|nr:Phospholipid scramblase 1,Phospholipid scramblase family member 5,Phospholipid scramblase 3,Phospholipid scramblase 2 [Mytilus edulis]